MANLPVIPETITVHLGAASNSEAENVKVSFPDYIKNVASSEVYPTWPENALIANIFAQISFALNRIYTEYYPSRGYSFDITNDTSIDQSFVKGRNIFDTINTIVDEIFNDYLVRRGFVEPLFAQYCNGTTTTCDGLSQWGSVDLAENGFSDLQIIYNYYGNDIDVIRNAPVQSINASVPLRPLRLGSTGNQVFFVQVRLNRISTNYPSIPKIPNPRGFFDIATEDAVREFQRIFYLTVDGIVGKSTWYKIMYIFNSVKRLNELDSEGLTMEEVQNQYPGQLQSGDTGDYIRIIQYMLAWIGQYENEVPQPAIDGIFGPETDNSVKAFQRLYELPQTGIVDEATYARMYDVYYGIIRSVPDDLFQNTARPYPGIVLSQGIQNEYVTYLQEYLNLISESLPDIPEVPVTGVFGPETTEAVRAFQRALGLEETGYVNAVTWFEITDIYESIKAGEVVQTGQFPGYTLEE